MIALMAPITVDDSNKYIGYELSAVPFSYTLTAGVYETIEDLCAELETGLSVNLTGVDIDIVEASGEYKIQITANESWRPYGTSLSNGWSQFGFTTGSLVYATTHTADTTPDNILITDGVGNDTHFNERQKSGYSLTVGGDVSTRAFSHVATRSIKWHALTRSQCDTLRDIWDSVFTNDRCYYSDDWECYISADSSDRLDKLTINYKKQARLAFTDRGAGNIYYDASLEMIYK